MSTTKPKKPKGRPVKGIDEAYSIPVNVRLSLEDWRKLRAIASSTNRTLSQVIRGWING